MSYFLVISILCQFSLSQAHATASIFGNVYNDSTLSFGNPAPAEPLPAEKIRVFVWNIYKGQKSGFAYDFGQLTYSADLALFQEATNEKDFVMEITAANPTFAWTLAKAFRQFNASYTGVATGSRVQAQNERVIYSDAKEPIAETPKTILLSEFPIEGVSEKLLVVNIHAINFVSLESYKSQIRQLLPELQKHVGPMMVAGDFNTWDPVRLYYLTKVFGPIGLTRLKIPNPDYFKFDHIFVRAMNAEFIFDLNHITSSDHAPMMVDLTFDLNKVRIYETNP